MKNFFSSAKKKLSFFGDWLFGFFRKIEAKWAMKTGMSAGLAFFVGSFVSELFHEAGPSRLVSGLWCAISAIIVSQIHVGSSFKAGWNRFLGSGIGSGLGAFFTLFMGANALSLGIGITCAVMVLAALKLRASISLTCSTLALVMILWKLTPVSSPWIFGFFRFIDACIGILISILVSIMILPERASSKMHQNTSQIVSLIYQLFRQVIFDQGEKNQNKKWSSLYQEIEQNLQKNFIFLEDAKLEILMKKDKIEKWSLLHRNLSHMGELVYSLRKVEKKQLKETSGHQLETLTEVLENFNGAFQEAAIALQTSKPVLKTFDLSRSIANLENAVEMCKKTNSEKKIYLISVENFYVLFYLLREIAEEVVEMTKNINYLNRPD